MNIVLVAARNFPVIKAGPDLATFLDEIDRAAIIFTRRATEGPDLFVAEMAQVMGFTVKRWVGEGGASNYIRDVDMVKEADVVYAFFDADHVGEGGTQHVVDKALDQRKRVVSFIWARRLVVVGSHDGDGESADDAAGPAGETTVAGEEAPELPGGSSEGTQEGQAGWASGAFRDDLPF